MGLVEGLQQSNITDVKYQPGHKHWHWALRKCWIWRCSRIVVDFDRLRLRGVSGAQDEFLLAATAQNLRRMAKWLMPMTEPAEATPA
ncbi:hypothetical protein EHZ25_38075 [Paraburkholderia tropica]|nr:hypothetical protein EHZ25_38075 [Paraburkholderia tropica]